MNGNNNSIVNRKCKKYRQEKTGLMYTAHIIHYSILNYKQMKQSLSFRKSSKS